MYQQSQTWLPSAQQMGLGEISFADLARAARRSRRGVGQFALSAPGGGIAPGSSCYDTSHDNGMIHCASLWNVIGSAFNPLSQSGNPDYPLLTTNCSASEASCMAAATGTTVPSTILSSAGTVPAPAAAPDACTTLIGISCNTLLWAGLAALAAFVVLRVVK
jgi:hypothetical protein